MNQEVVRSCTSRTRVGCYSKLHMIFMGKAIEIIQLVIDHDTIFCVICIFFYFITGSYSSRRGCFVWLTQKDTTICVQTYSELCKLIKKKKPFVNECCVWNASFVSRSRKTEWSTEIFFWNPKLSFWNVWKLTWLYFFVEKAADSPNTVHDRMVYVFIHQNTALVYCVKSLGYVFLWRYVIVFMLLLHKELFTVFEFNFSMIPDVLLSKCELINCQIYKSEMYHVYEL